MQPTEREMKGAASSISCFNGRSSRIMLQDAEEQQQKPIQSSDLRQVSSESQESSHEDFFDQILFNLPWTDLSYGNPKTAWDANSPPVSQKLAVEFQLAGGEGIQFPQLYDESLLLASRLRQNQISGNGGGASDIQLDRYSQPQVLLPIPVSPGNVESGDSRSLVDGSRNDVDSTFKSHGPLSGEGMYNGFGGSLQVKASHLPAANHQQFNHTQTFNGGSGTAPPKQKVRARRGQATDPHSIAERLRRERIAERMKALQELVPNANKTDKASMLDEIIDYVKFLQLQVKVLSMSRLGGAAPFAADISPKGENDGMTAAEQQVAKLMEEDMGAAMQYLQGKGLCLMPISLASAISAATNSTISDISLSSANNHAS